MTGFIEAAAIGDFEGQIVDCRFSLSDADAGRREFCEGHIPGAVYLDLNRDMSTEVREHGGRHPLPSPQDFANRLAELGIGSDTPTLLYDNSRYAFAARAWWMICGLGYRPPGLLAGGYKAWIESGGHPASSAAAVEPAIPAVVPAHWPRCCDREKMLELQAQGALLIDAREAQRYRGEHEPIDPVAGHIPGADNMPWQDFSAADGEFLDSERLSERWGSRADATPLVVYCGSGVSACVAILSLAMLGRDDVWLYGGSWSDWCSYL